MEKIIFVNCYTSDRIISALTIDNYPKIAIFLITITAPFHTEFNTGNNDQFITFRSYDDT